MRKFMLAGAAALALALSGTASAEPCAPIACEVEVDGELVPGTQEVCCPDTEASVNHLADNSEICGAIVSPAGGSIAGCIQPAEGSTAGCVFGAGSGGPDSCSEADGALACHDCGCANVGECVPNE